MPTVENTFAELGGAFDPRSGMSTHYRSLVARSGRVLDIGGRNKQSISAKRLIAHGADPELVVCTDILPEYEPDLVDDITRTTIEPETFDGVYCDAVLEHVTEYWVAVNNIHRVLRPGGQVFIYVPFMFDFHDEMDYHRFTVTEVARMLEDFTEVKVFLPDTGGYGWVLPFMLTYGQVTRFPRVHAAVALGLNTAMTLAVRALYRLGIRPRGNYSSDQLVQWAVHLNFNHGFFAWARK